MTARMFALLHNTVRQLRVDTMLWYWSGLYCRTQISV